jgi:hypothetical protein
MNSVDLNMRSVQVESKTRALKATWTSELANELDMYQNLDIEKELAYLLKEEIHKQRVSKRKKSINKIFQN